jgi:hypothetical protein
MGLHAEASHLYYSVGWLFESEQGAMIILQKLGREQCVREQVKCMLEKGSHACLLQMRAGVKAYIDGCGRTQIHGPKVRSCCKLETTLLLWGCR